MATATSNPPEPLPPRLALLVTGLELALVVAALPLLVFAQHRFVSTSPWWLTVGIGVPTAWAMGSPALTYERRRWRVSMSGSVTALATAAFVMSPLTLPLLAVPAWRGRTAVQRRWNAALPLLLSAAASATFWGLADPRDLTSGALTARTVLAGTASGAAILVLGPGMIMILMWIIVRETPWGSEEWQPVGLFSDALLIMVGVTSGLLLMMTPWATILVVALFALVGLGLRALKMLQASGYDAKTGLLTLSPFTDQAARELARAARTSDSVSLLMIDIDHFRDLNNRNGHLAGDEVLRQVALTIGRATRSQDLASRFGGEEFVVLLPSTNIHDAHAIAERLRDHVSLLAIPWQSRRISVTCSIGVSGWVAGEDLTELIGRADAALYEAKSAGRNAVRVANVPQPRPAP